MTPRKLKLLWGQTFSSAAPIFPPNWLENSVALIYTIFRIAVINTFSRMDGNCVASSVKLLYLGILYRFIGARKFLIGFFYRFICEKNVGQQNCIAFFDFFSQKLCICIALIDTFLSIAAHHCPIDCSKIPAQAT
jgi:hypothetical protein